MLNDYSRYHKINSRIRNLNPLCKVLALIIYVLMFITASHFKTILVLYIILAFTICFSNIQIKEFINPLWNMKIFLIFMFLINFIFCRDVYTSIVFVTKIGLIVINLHVLIATTTINELVVGFNYLLKPLNFFGLETGRVSTAIALSLFFLPIMNEEANKIIKSQTSRGFNYKSGSYKDKILSIKYVFVPIFINSIKRTKSICDGMEFKQFSFENDCHIYKIRWHLQDAYMITCHLVIFVLVLIKEVVV